MPIPVVPTGDGTVDVNDTQVTGAELDVLDETPDEEEEEVVDDGEENPDDINDDDEGEEEEEEDEGEEEEDLEEEPEEEEEEEEEEEPEEEDDLDTELEGSAWQRFKEKHPDLVKDKDFKQLFFSHRAFTEVFPGGVREAREAAAKAMSVDLLDDALNAGNVSPALESLNKVQIEHLAKNILPALGKLNPNYFVMATRPLIINTLHDIHNYAIKIKDDNLRKSVRNISNYLTNSPDLPPRETKVEEDPRVKAELDKLRQEREGDFVAKRRDFLAETDNAVMTRLTKMVSSEIDKGERNVDNDKRLTQFAREAITERVLRDIYTRVKSSPKFMSRMNNLHMGAVRGSFDREYSRRIVSAYLGAAKALVPNYVNRHRQAAHGNTAAKSKTKGKVVNKSGKVNSRGTATSGSSRRVDMSRTSDVDFLNDKIVYKEK